MQQLELNAAPATLRCRVRGGRAMAAHCKGGNKTQALHRPSIMGSSLKLGLKFTSGDKGLVGQTVDAISSDLVKYAGLLLGCVCAHRRPLLAANMAPNLPRFHLDFMQPSSKNRFCKLLCSDCPQTQQLLHLIANFFHFFLDNALAVAGGEQVSNFEQVRLHTELSQQACERKSPWRSELYERADVI